MTTTTKNSNRAILWMLTAVGMFSVMDAGLKWLTPHFGAMQIAAIRGLASLPFLLLWIGATRSFASLKPVNWPLHLLRGALGIFMLSSFAYGLNTLSLADTYSLFFIAPLLITVLAAPILGEAVGRARWIAILVGLVGVLVVLRPSGAGWYSLGALAVLGAASAYAVGAITVRLLAKTDSMQSMMFWMTLLVALGATVLTGQDWREVSAPHWPVVVLIGITGSLGQYALTHAFKIGEASAIAPFEYAALAFGVAIDWMVWQATPDRWMLFGAAIIVGSGVYLARSERNHLESEHP